MSEYWSRGQKKKMSEIQITRKISSIVASFKDEGGHETRTVGSLQTLKVVLADDQQENGHLSSTTTTILSTTWIRS